MAYQTFFKPQPKPVHANENNPGIEQVIQNTQTPLPTLTPILVPTKQAEESKSLDSEVKENYKYISPVFMGDVQKWAEDIDGWTSPYDTIDNNLSASIMQWESGGDKWAKSKGGALGLYQVMLRWFDEDESPYDPDTNAAKAMWLLDLSLKKYPTLRAALADYNGGYKAAEWVSGWITREELAEYYKEGGLNPDEKIDQVLRYIKGVTALYYRAEATLDR